MKLINKNNATEPKIDAKNPIFFATSVDPILSSVSIFYYHEILFCLERLEVHTILKWLRLRSPSYRYYIIANLSARVPPARSRVKVKIENFT